jgi:ribosomal protein S18 acetylase RimI-like enzyme
MTSSHAQVDIRPFQMADEPAVVALWDQCGLVVPQNDPHEDIASKMAFQPDLFFVGVIDGQIVATVMAGYEGHRGWINYLAVAPACQRTGIGSQMMQRAEETLRALGCPKINLQVRASNQAVIAFYESLGFFQEDRVSLGKRFAHTEESST